MPVARAASSLRALARAARHQPGEPQPGLGLSIFHRAEGRSSPRLARERGTCSAGRMLQRTGCLDISRSVYCRGYAIRRVGRGAGWQVVAFLGRRPDIFHPICRARVRQPVSARHGYSPLRSLCRLPARVPRVSPRRRRRAKPAPPRRAHRRKDFDPQERGRQDGALCTKDEAE